MFDRDSVVASTLEFIGILLILYRIVFSSVCYAIPMLWHFVSMYDVIYREFTRKP